MTKYEIRDNEFIAWYPCALSPDRESAWERKPAAFYIHIPFCEAICDYCGFSVASLKGAHVDSYVDHLVRELQMYHDAGRFSDRVFTVGSYGGGTPSTLEPEQFLRLAETTQRLMRVSDDAEITVEVNPLSLSEAKMDAYKIAGINRLSLGIQSFNEDHLRTIGRPHRTRDIARSLDIVRGSGIANFSLDLMYGIPGQSVDDVIEDAKIAADTGATHLSCFRLEIIPFTRLSLRRGAGLLPPVTDSSEEKRIEEAIVTTLRANGYRRYGVFNFAKEVYECEHNHLIFSAPQNEFFGFGNSAFSFVNNTSYCNYARVDQYCSALDSGKPPISHSRRANSLELMSRFFVLGLKMEGVPHAAFESAHGMPAEAVFGDLIGRLMAEELLQFVDGSYSLTEEGRFYVNNICKEFYVLDNIKHPQHSFSFVPTITQKDVEYFRRKAQQSEKVS